MIQINVKRKFLFLLISLLFLCFIYPLIPRNAARFLTLDIAFLFILLSGIYAISENRAVFVISLFLALEAFGSTTLNYLFLTSSLSLVPVSAYGLFFVLMAVSMLSSIMKAELVLE